jgi:hypothetical protein
MAPRHSKLAAYEHELIALVQAMKHWRPYLWGRPFVIRTDHYSLKFLLDQRLATILQHQWVSKLIGFDFKVEFKPGVTNVVADALSRRDTKDMAEVMALSIPSFSLFDDLRSEMDADDALCALRIEVATGGRDATWSVVDGLITVGGQVYVPATSPSLPAILDNAHGAGHEGTEKTLHRLRMEFHVQRACALVRDFVRACTICQRNKSEHLNPVGLLQPLVPLGHPYSGGTPATTVILTVVDWFSKYAHFMPLGHPYSATTVARGGEM